MKKSVTKIALALAVTCAMVFAGCQQAASDKPSSSGTGPTIPTAESLSGATSTTWKNTYSWDSKDKGVKDGTTTGVTSLTINADKSFLEVGQNTTKFLDSTKKDSVNYQYRKGSWDLVDGKLTLSYSHYYSSQTPVSDISAIVWVVSGYSSTLPVRLIGGTLYEAAFVRSGSGSGIEGEWTMEMSSVSTSGTAQASYYKYVYTFKAGALTAQTYSGTASGTYPATPSSTSTDTYTFDAATGKGSVVSSTGGNLASFVVSGDVFALEQEAYVKQ